MRSNRSLGRWITCLCILLLCLLPLTACNGADTTADTTAVDGTTADMTGDETTVPGDETTAATFTDHETTAAESATDDETTAEDDGIVARVAVFSDVHIGKKNVSPSPESKFAAALEQLGTILPGYDAVAFAGDMTDLGTDAQYMEFLKIWNAGKAGSAILCTAIGNHEFFRDGVVRYGGESPEFLKECKDAFGKYFGELNTDTVVGGVHIITISADSSAAEYKSSEEFIIKHVEAAAAEDPTMPIILVSHEGAGAYHDSGSGRFTQATLECLKKYPQIIFFSGHTHFSLYDPRMIQQKDYTTIQTSTLGADLWNYNSIGPDQPTGKDNVSEGHTLTVSEEGVVTITRYDFFRKTAIGEPWVIDIPAVVESKRSFTYTAARAGKAEAPVFPEGAAVTVSGIGANEATVAFPAATVTDEVSDGQIYLYYIAVTAKGASTPFMKQEMLGEYYLGRDAAETYTQKLEGLLGGTTYTVTVTAETPFGKTAVLSSSEFTTEAAPVVDDSDAKVLLFSDYRTGSYADQSASKLDCEVFGSPRIEDGVAILDKQSAYAYKMTEAVYKQIPASFTLEFNIYIESDQTYPWGYVTLVGNTEAGGFGVSYYQNGEMQMEINIGGAYQTLRAVPGTGKWVHVVAAYDGSTMKIYLDGKLAASKACSGNIKHVAEISRKLMVGADVNGEGGTQTVSNIRMGFIRLYDKGLGADTVAKLAEEAKS